MSKVILMLLLAVVGCGVAMANENKPFHPQAAVRLADPNSRFSLRVYLLPSSESESTSEKVARQILMNLRAESQEVNRRAETIDSGIEWVESSKEADICILLKDDKLWWLPADGEGRSLNVNTSSDELDDRLTSFLNNISRQIHLIRLAKSIAIRDSAGVAKGLEVKASVIQHNGGKRVPLAVGSPQEIHGNDKIEFVFHNKGPAMVDVTALYFDIQYGITAMYPDPGAYNRINVGADDTMTLQIAEDLIPGIEGIILFLQDADKDTQNADFSYLADVSLDGMLEAAKSIGSGTRKTGSKMYIFKLVAGKK